MRELTRPIHAAMHHVARAYVRIPSFGRARLRRDGEADLMIRIGNISRSGFMGETPLPPRPGTTVQLVLPFGAVKTATVRWSLNRRFGCRLDGAFSGRQMLVLTLLAGARVSSILLLAFLLLADLHDRTHLLLLVSAVLVYTTLALGLAALGAHVSRTGARILAALELPR